MSAPANKRSHESEDSCSLNASTVFLNQTLANNSEGSNGMYRTGRSHSHGVHIVGFHLQTQADHRSAQLQNAKQAQQSLFIGAHNCRTQNRHNKVCSQKQFKSNMPYIQRHNSATPSLWIRAACVTGPCPQGSRGRLRGTRYRESTRYRGMRVCVRGLGSAGQGLILSPCAAGF